MMSLFDPKPIKYKVVRICGYELRSLNEREIGLEYRAVHYLLMRMNSNECDSNPSNSNPNY